MLVKYCTKCGVVMKYAGNSLCEECTKQYKMITKPTEDKVYNQRCRNKKADAFYHSKEWKNLSKLVLTKSGYVCAECGGLATEVHHKKEISTHWDERFELDNLESLCTKCHNRKRAGR